MRQVLTARSVLRWMPAGTWYVADRNNDRITIGVPQQVTGGGSGFNAAIGAVVAGSANPNGNDATVWFEYGPDTTYGNQTAPQDIGSGNGFVSVTGTLTNVPLTAPGTTAWHSTGAGTFYGADRTLNDPGYTVSDAVVTADLGDVERER